jgi:hypothetical protein
VTEVLQASSVFRAQIHDGEFLISCFTHASESSPWPGKAKGGDRAAAVKLLAESMRRSGGGGLEIRLLGALLVPYLH